MARALLAAVFAVVMSVLTLLPGSGQDVGGPVAGATRPRRPRRPRSPP